MTITLALNGKVYYKMYRLRVETTFDAAHKLVGYPGVCAKLHGHTWKVEAFVVGEELDSVGILVDFKVIKERMDSIIKNLDHSFLNDCKEIGNPTSENLSRFVYGKLKELPSKVRLEKVRVWENSRSWCEYVE